MTNRRTNLSLLLDAVDGADQGAEGSLPGLEIIGGNTALLQGIHEDGGEVVELDLVDVARNVAEGHVVDLAEDLESVVSGGDQVVQAVGDQSGLLHEVGVALEGVEGDVGELGERLLAARSILEEPMDGM